MPADPTTASEAWSSRSGDPEDDRQPDRRLPGDDFFCLRFRVWYASLDCALRTRFRTAPGCLGCEQGRFNLQRHRAALRGRRFPLELIAD